MKNNVIPIVFAVDDTYVPCLTVTIESLIENASQEYFYKFYVLNTGLDKNLTDKLKKYENGNNCSLEYVDVEKQLSKVEGKLYLRDYFTNTTYYRFFIPSLFPQYDKMLYLDADVVILDDISKMFNTELGDNFIGAVQEEVMSTVKVFGDYVEKGLGIPCEKYFNAGVMVMNLKALRDFDLDAHFFELLKKFTFEVTQDQDYLNIICENKVYYFDLGWNKAPLKNDDFDDKNLKLIHFKLYYKPWNYKEVNYQNYFWHYAEKSPFYNELLKRRADYPQDNIIRDLMWYKKLMKLAQDYICDSSRYILFRKDLVK